MKTDERTVLEVVRLSYLLMETGIFETKMTKMGIVGAFSGGLGKTSERIIFYKLPEESQEGFLSFVEKELKIMTGCSSLEEIVLRAESKGLA